IDIDVHVLFSRLFSSNKDLRLPMAVLPLLALSFELLVLHDQPIIAWSWYKQWFSVFLMLRPLIVPHIVMTPNQLFHNCNFTTVINYDKSAECGKGLVCVFPDSPSPERLKDQGPSKLPPPSSLRSSCQTVSKIRADSGLPEATFVEREK
ncbi:hypothetical protein STEG23_020182, partial [Scotinomys teguina]